MTSRPAADKGHQRLVPNPFAVMKNLKMSHRYVKERNLDIDPDQEHVRERDRERGQDRVSRRQMMLAAGQEGLHRQRETMCYQVTLPNGVQVLPGDPLLLLRDRESEKVHCEEAQHLPRLPLKVLVPLNPHQYHNSIHQTKATK